MSEPRQTRKLTAILAADVAGYSRLMSHDETATLRSLNECRALFHEQAAVHGGRIVDTAGDSVLAEFKSVVEAVRCATTLQAALHTKNELVPENRKMLYRIGVNLGDVIEENGALYGDGVNVAARLQTLAEPGGALHFRKCIRPSRDEAPAALRVHRRTAGQEHSETGAGISQCRQGRLA